MSNNSFDFVAIGDIVTDAFIKLREDKAEVVCDEKGNACKISMNFGDKIPYDSVKVIPAVGNSPNAAVSAARLGLKSAVVTDVGDDSYGKEAIGALVKNGVDDRFIKMHKDKVTNYHFVLRYGAERTILIKHEEFPYEITPLEGAKWIYLSSLGENSIPFHHELALWLEKNPQVKLAFQPGTWQIKLGLEELKDIYEVAELFFCNVEEARTILGDKSSNVPGLLKAMHLKGPKIVVITDGPKGAYTYDGAEMWHMPIYPDPKEPVDRTGAGDSFSSTFTSMLASDLSIPEALKRAPINSMSVVQYIGAQEGLLSREKLEEFLANAPAGYEASQLE